MKYLYVGLLILCLLLCGCIWSRREVGRRTEAAAAPLTLALDALDAGDVAAGRRYAALAAAEWARQEGVLASLVSHNYTEEIAAALAELPRIPAQDLGRTIAGLLRAVRALGEMERAVWRNIF